MRCITRRLTFDRQQVCRQEDFAKIAAFDWVEEVRITYGGRNINSFAPLAKLVNLKKIKQCVMEQVEVSDEDREKDAQGEENSQGGKGKGNTDTDTETETDTDTDTEEEVVNIVDDSEDLGNDKNPNQTPTQSNDK